jgi:hypothetical protein
MRVDFNGVNPRQSLATGVWPKENNTMQDDRIMSLNILNLRIANVLDNPTEL